MKTDTSAMINCIGHRSYRFSASLSTCYLKDGGKVTFEFEVGYLRYLWSFTNFQTSALVLK